MKKDLSKIITFLVLIFSCIASVYYVVIDTPRIIDDTPGRMIVEYSAAAIIAPLIGIGYLFVILNNEREIPFRIRDVDFSIFTFDIRRKIIEGINDYKEWKKNHR